MRVFQWVAGAKRPLAMHEMAEAISIDPDDKAWEEVLQRCPMDEYKVLENCANLITLNNDDTIQFAHSTALGYLCSQHLIPQDCQRFTMDQDDLNARLAHICVTYLSFPGFEQDVLKQTQRVVKCTPLSGRDIAEQIPMMLRTSNSALERGIGNTMPHVRASPLGPSRVDVKRTVKLTPEVAVSPTKARCMLNYIAENWWKHCSKVDTLERTFGEDWTSKFDDLCFHRKFSVQHLPWLLPAFRDESLIGGDEFEIPFTWAVTSDHEALQHFIMSKLHKLGPPLTNPVPWTRKNLDEISSHSSNIQVYITAAPGTWFSVPREVYNHFPDPLFVATCRGYTKVCQSLLEGIRSTFGSLKSELKGIATGSTAGEPRSMLHVIFGVACELGRVEIVKFLLQFDAAALMVTQTTSPGTLRIDIRDIDGATHPSVGDPTWTPIELALANGHLDIVKDLLVAIEGEIPRISSLGTGIDLRNVLSRRLTKIDLSQLGLTSSKISQRVIDQVLADLTRPINLQKMMSIASYPRTRLAHPANPNLLALYLGITTDGDLDRHCPTMACLRSQTDNSFLWDAPTWKAAALRD